MYMSCTFWTYIYIFPKLVWDARLEMDACTLKDALDCLPTKYGNYFQDIVLYKSSYAPTKAMKNVRIFYSIIKKIWLKPTCLAIIEIGIFELHVKVISNFVLSFINYPLPTFLWIIFSKIFWSCNFFQLLDSNFWINYLHSHNLLGCSIHTLFSLNFNVY